MSGTQLERTNGSPARALTRLRTRKDFQVVYDRGTAYRSRFVILVCAPGEADGTRFGVVASRKVGNAVRRNRGKRLLRESVRRLEPCVRREPVDLALIARAGISDLRFGSLLEEVTSLYARAGLLREERA